MKSLGEALPEEQKRVRELILMYRDPLLAGTSAFALSLMELALKEADQAVISGDIVDMSVAYRHLKEFR